MDLATRLGDAAARHRRHRKVLLLGIALLVVAAVLIFVVGDEGDDGPPSEVAATCRDFADRIQREFSLSFPDGAPVNDEAAAQYLSHAFADTMEELVEALRTFDVGGDIAAAVDALADRIDEVRASPADYVRLSPLDGITSRFDDADLAECGSEFFRPSE